MIRFTSLIILISYLNIFWFQIGIVEGIVGGEDARPGQFKYQVSIFNDDMYVCGGVIITVSHILTAAQCIELKNNFIHGNFWVKAGVYYFSESQVYSRDAEVEKAYIPKIYRFNERYGYRSSPKSSITGDIAVLKLRTLLNFNNNALEFVKWYQVIYTDFKSVKNLESYIAGYGHESVTETIRTSKHRYIKYGKDSIKLKYAKTKIISPRQCSKMHNGFVEATHICSQVLQRNPDVFEGTCEGDEGSGLVLSDNTIMGILIKTPRNCDESKTAALYTKIAPYTTFILNAINNKKSPDIYVYGMPSRPLRDFINIKN